MEHLAIAEAILFKSAEQAVAGTANQNWQEETKGKTDYLWRTVPNRIRRFSSPEAAIPRGKLPPEEALDHFLSARSRTIEFVGNTDVALKAFTSQHFFWGTVNAYHWLLHLVLHNFRHNQQILEIMADRWFPH